jgi:HK97 family phage prohead protease
MSDDETVLLDEERDEMSAKAINDLPDSAFAFIEPGGEKDTEGKTTPRSLRHFPVHDKPHVQNALARAPQSPFGDKAMPKILAAAKKFGIEAAEQKSDDTGAEERAECPTCSGTGKIMDGHRDCPDCNGTGSVQENSADTGADERAVKRRKERRRAVPLGRELRHFPVAGLEVREKADTNEITITGRPIVYNEPYLVRDALGEFEERMLPGCASEILSRGVDCRLLLNHEGLAMARTTARTLQLLDTPEALTFKATLDARQQIANDFAIAVERGDMDQMSVGMIVGRDVWGEAGGRETRDVHGLDDLLDVSGVTYPCSPSTTLEIAKRMALEMPVESRARIRQLEVALRSGRMAPEELADLLALLQGNEERAGQVLGKAHKGQLIDAAKAIHGVLEAAGYDPADLIETGEEGSSEDGSEGTPGGNGGVAAQDGSLARSDTIVDPGEGIRATTKTARVLSLELEARRHRRKAA